MAKQFDGFKLVAKAADAKSIIPILSQVYVCGGFAIATDCDIEVIAATAMPDGAYNVKGEPLAKAADRDDYVTLNTPELASADAVPLGDFAAMVALVFPAISYEETRYYLNGVYCEFQGGLKVTTCDGHRLLHLAPPNAPAFEFAPFILPRETAKLLAGIRGGNWSLKATATRVEFRDSVSGVVIRSKVVDGSYPDYHRIIPKMGFKQTWTGDSKDCLEVAKRCAAYGSSRLKSIKFDGGNMTVRADADDLAPLETKWQLAIEGEGDPVTIGFNASYVRDFLTVAAGVKDSVFSIRLTDSASPVRFEFATPGLVGVLMPLRV